MDTTVLDVEKFDAVKELAGIQTEIATARAVLNEIKSSEKEYYEERERETIKRVEGVLAKSENVLRAIGGNHDALSAFHSEAKDLTRDLQAILLLFKEVRKQQVEVTELERAELEEKAEQLSRVEKELTVKRSIIEADIEANQADRRWIAEEKRKLTDERQTLQRAMDRLKTKK